VKEGNRMRYSRLAILAVLLFSCQNGRTQPLAAGAGAGENSKYYQVQVTPSEVTVGTEAKLVLSVAAVSGWKWNAEYPAKFKVSGPTAVRLGKSEFSTRAGDVEAGKTEARITIPATASSQGTFTLDVTGSFSVCNDTSCKIMRDEKVAVEVTVR